jgi:hypothetical protein
MLRVGRHHELAPPHGQQVVFPQHALHPLMVHLLALATEFRGDPPIAVTAPMLDGDLLNQGAQLHVLLHSMLPFQEAVESCPAHWD